MFHLGQIGQTFSAATVLDASTKVKMNPLELRKAGVIIENMKGDGYSETQINMVCKALFLDQVDADVKEAWKVFVKAHSHLPLSMLLKSPTNTPWIQKCDMIQPCVTNLRTQGWECYPGCG